ncbi:DMT family transporter [candidate division KSB1 bacterium]
MRNPKFLALFTLVTWSFSATLTRLISIKSQFLLWGISFFFTFLTLLVYFLINNRGRFGDIFRNLKWKYLFFGLFGYFIYAVALIQCFVSFDSASEPTILNYTWPVFTVLFTEAVFRRERKKLSLRLVEITGVLTGFTSIIILGTEGFSISIQLANVKGIGLGLIAGASYGFYSGYSSRVPEEDHSIFLLASIFSSLILMMIFSAREFSIIHTFTLRDILYVAFFGIIGNGLGYITWTSANRIALEKKINITSVISIIFFLPLTSLIIITVVLKETAIFRPYFIVSLILLIISMIISQKTN